MLDIVYRCDVDNKIDYVWFDTGLEYQATKDHLKYLEEKYEIKIKTFKAKKPIPITCKEYGQPFLSKNVSENIMRLQGHDFQWEDGNFEELNAKYPKCKSALHWWCNDHTGSIGSFNISWNKWLKEFLMANPPRFAISNKCCQYAKKNVAHDVLKGTNYNLSIIGVRRAEGGQRSSTYKNCFDNKEVGVSNYRPLFWYANSDKTDYEVFYNVSHSKCYTEYGLPRTGCAGCPFGRDFEFELEVIQKYEPKLYKAVTTIFKDSYEYTRRYREFVKVMNEKHKNVC